MARYRPEVDPMEPRLLQAADVSGSTIAVVQGAVTPGRVATSTVQVGASTLSPGRSSTVIRLTVTALDGSPLDPRLVSVSGASGRPLAPYNQGTPGRQPAGQGAAILVADPSPGPITVKVAGNGNTSGAYQVRASLPGDLDGSGRVDGTDLQLLVPIYGSRVGDANYNPTADFLGTGYVGQQDARLLVRNIANPSNRRLQLHLQLSPGEAVPHPVQYNSGGVTLQRSVTVLGKTLPNSAVFVDGLNGIYSFDGPLVAADASGRFSYTFTVGQNFGNASNIYDGASSFLIVAPNGQQMIRNYPIVRMR